MTPLAHYLTRQIASRPKDRETIWREPQNIKNLRDLMHDIHCFEVTACLPLIVETYESFKGKPIEQSETVYETFGFLPAPKTWIEFRHASGNRMAVAMEECDGRHAYNGGKPSAVCTFVDRDSVVNLGMVSTQSGDFYAYGGLQRWPQYILACSGPEPDMAGQGILALAHTLLVLINSPKIIGRRQHMPHAGLERRLTKGLGAGKFPLHAWTEILLQVNKPPEIDDGEPHEAHLTGRRALHFCRKHIRIQNGQLVYVSAHWRGDPALGIKQSRYNVQPSP
jgi:hypothetical protein